MSRVRVLGFKRIAKVKEEGKEERRYFKVERAINNA